MNPKVSVIIPALNEVDRISKSIDALLLQDYPDIEIIVIDNGSTDGTYDLVKKMGINVLLETKTGTMSACETGRKVAKGDIIVRMDADCIPSRDWISKGISFFKNEKVVGLSGPYDYFDGDKYFRFVSSLVQKYIYPLSNILTNFISGGAIMIGGNSFMKANALEKIGGFDTKIKFYGDDSDTATRLASIGKVIYSPKLTIKSSARRFQREGIFNTIKRYNKAFSDISLFKNKKKYL